jgi:drug/metabolite transporter (DMT)-like permease
MTFYSFPSANLPHSKNRRGIAKPDRVAAETAVILYFGLAALLLPRSEYLHSLGGGILTFGAIILASWFVKRGWLPGLSVLAVGFISFAVLVMPTLPAMGGRVLRAIPIGFVGVQAAILLWAVLQWPYTLAPRSHVSFGTVLQYGLFMATGISLVATLPILLTFFSDAASPKTILLAYPGYFAGFLAAAIVYWSLQSVAHLAVGRYLIGALGGTCVYGAIAPVVFLFRNEPIEFPLLIAIAAITGGFIGPALALDSKDQHRVGVA